MSAMQVNHSIASLEQLSREEIEEILLAAQERLGIVPDDDDAEWEASHIEVAHGDALLPDGQLDFAKLRTRNFTLKAIQPMNRNPVL